MNIDLTPIFQAIIALLAALVTYKLIPWIKSKTTEQQQMNLQAAARIAVYAAEQIFGAGQGEEKLDYVMSRLEDMGFSAQKELVREAIETAVKQMNGAFSVAAILQAAEGETEEPPADETTVDADEIE